MNSRVSFEPCSLQPCLDHPQTARGKDGTPERAIRLQTHDYLVVAVNPTWRMRQYRGRCRDINIQHTFLALGLEIRPTMLVRADELIEGLSRLLTRQLR